MATGSVSEKFSLFTDSLRTAGPVVGMLVVLALPGLWLALRRPETTLLAIWFVLSLTGFALGGLFHGHYYVGPLTPLCALAALTLAAVPPRVGLALGLAALVLPDLQGLAGVHRRAARRERSLASTSDSRIVKDGAVGRYLHAHTRSGDRVYALYADASLYLAVRAGARPTRTSGSSASSTSRARCSACATRSPARPRRATSRSTSSRARSTSEATSAASSRAATGTWRRSRACRSGALLRAETAL